MGSVKDLIVKKPAVNNEMGVGIFKFTDDYSVFDYGKMPDKIPGKGEALCRMAAYNFKQIEKIGIKSHFRGLLSGTEMEVNLVRVLYPQKGEISLKTRNYLIPLEVMFRNSLPEGSSVFKRLKTGQVTLEQLGLSKEPLAGEKLDNPIIDVSTKLEPTDRYIDWDEAKRMAGLTEEQIKELKEKALKINEFITEKAKELGLEHADGKVEFGLTPENKIIVVDVIGTLDENRMLKDGIHLSKQVLRDYYKALPWAEKIEEAKARTEEKKWPKPPKLPRDLIAIVSNMYKAVTEAWIEEKIWNAPSIDNVISDYKKFLEESKNN